MQALHGAQQGLHRPLHRRAQAGGADGGGRAGAGQVVVHLALRRGHLLLHQARQRRVVLGGGIAQDAQRRVHRMRQVAGLGAGALHDVGIRPQHMVELVDQRLQLVGELAVQLGGLAGAHRGQALAQQVQRLKGQLQLHGNGHHQAQRQRAQGGQQHGGEALHRLGHQGLVGRHGQAQQGGFGLGQLQRPADGHQLVVLAVAQLQHGVAAARGAGKGRVPRQGQHLVPQGARAQHAQLGRALLGQQVHLPVQAGQRGVQACIPGHGQHFHPLRGIEVDAGAELVQLAHQLSLQLLVDVFLEQAAQAPARHGHRQCHPGQRAQQQALAQRAMAQRQGAWQLHAAPSAGSRR